MFSGYNLKNSYIFENLIGSGGMGEVWSAKRVALGDRVAIKVLKLNKQQSPESQRDRLKKEAEITSILNHPNICKVFDLIEEENACFLIMELLEGVDLQTLLSMPEILDRVDRVQFGLYISKQILKALVEAHNINHSTISRILHRDIKPANIFITKFGEVKLLDLGIAKAETDLDNTITNNLFYSIHYTDPLLWENGSYNVSKYSSSSDIYGLGLVFYEIISGEKAFAGEGKKLFEALEKGIVPSIAAYNSSKELNSIFEKWTNRSYEKRFLNAKELLQELMNLTSKSTLDDSIISNIVLLLIKNELKNPIKHTEKIEKKNDKKFFNGFLVLMFGLLFLGSLSLYMRKKNVNELSKKNSQLDLNAENIDLGCDSNNPDRCNSLGFKYLKGEGVKQDHVLAKSMFEKAAMKGLAEAQSRLGYMYLNGLGGSKDYLVAKSLFEKAGNQGYAKAQLNLGMLYLHGLGVLQDKEKARFWFEKASSQGLQEADEQLRLLSIDKKLPIKDESYFRRACNNGALNACTNVAKYEYNNGNKNKAKSLYEKACHYGDINACLSLGLLEKELGNEKEARYYLTMACRSNSLKACEAIGDISQLNSNEREAISAFAKKCESGNKHYCFYLCRLYSNKKLVDESIKYLEKSLELGFSDWDKIEEDEELTIIKKDKRFAILLSRYKK